ncbi:MAG: hypothetical protein Q7R47_03940, partial [Candidatus Diapherotrites archaeon]|nr:hypothetical protein [Candidatus Diapherotrites archaeon]
MDTRRTELFLLACAILFSTVSAQIPGACASACAGQQAGQLLSSLQGLLALDCSPEHLAGLSDPEVADQFNQAIVGIGELDGPDRILTELKKTGADFCSDFTANSCSSKLKSPVKLLSSTFETGVDKLFEQLSPQQASLAGIATGFSKEDLKQKLLEKKACVDELVSRLNAREWLFQSSCDSGLPQITMVEDCSTKGTPPGCDERTPADVCRTSTCGNGVVEEPSEACEANVAIAKTCADSGFGEGSLSCTANSCQFDFSACPTFESTQHQQVPSAQQCTAYDGTVGITGQYGTPKVSPEYLWNWQSRCIGTDYFCDATQLTIEIVRRLNSMKTGNQTSNSFEINLMADGLSEDFRKDFDHYYSDVAFGSDKPPSYYSDSGWDAMISNPAKLSFEPARIDEPGTYRVSIAKKEDQYTVSLSKTRPPSAPSLLYYIPMDGEIGLSKRPDEAALGRDGYGSNVLSQHSLAQAKDLVSTWKNFDVTIDSDLDSVNGVNRGKL